MIDQKIQDDILSTVNSLEKELINLCCNMVRIPSVNPTYTGEIYERWIGGETKVAEFLKPQFENIGLETDIWEEEKGRANLVGLCQGRGNGKSLIFNGHIDVVPPGDAEAWTKTTPWSGEVSDGKIWGRGSCDNKSGNAAAFIAMKAVLKAGYKPKGDVLIECVSGEEMMNTQVGTGATIKRGYKADAAIVVEQTCYPQRLGLHPTSPGLFYMVVKIKGKATHSSLRSELIRAGGKGSEIGVSSIDKTMVIYEGLRKLEEQWGQTKIHPLFSPGHFVIHPGVITGGPSGPFVISNESRIEYAIWHAPQDSEEEVKREIEDQIALFTQTDPWLRENPPEVQWKLWWPPYDVPSDAPICSSVARSYEAVMGEPVKYSGFIAVDDATFLNRAGIPTINIGPGDVRNAHAANEYVDIAEVLDAAKIYALSIADWCGVE